MLANFDIFHEVTNTGIVSSSVSTINTVTSFVLLQCFKPVALHSHEFLGKREAEFVAIHGIQDLKRRLGIVTFTCLTDESSVLNLFPTKSADCRLHCPTSR